MCYYRQKEEILHPDRGNQWLLVMAVWKSPVGIVIHSLHSGFVGGSRNGTGAPALSSAEHCCQSGQKGCKVGEHRPAAEQANAALLPMLLPNLPCIHPESSTRTPSLKDDLQAEHPLQWVRFPVLRWERV